jgi:zinc protease
MATVTKLDNGLKVILKQIPGATAVSVWIGYHIGSRNERPGMTGSTHWVEHMLFKGGGKLKKGDIDLLIGRLGGKLNAFTDTDFTAYFETVPADAVDTALFIEAERMRNAAFEQKEFESERTVVISEREGAENMPEFVAEEELWSNAFHIHPYHWLPIGWKQDLQRLDRDTMYRHYLRYYAPNNAAMVVVGGFDEAATMEKIRARFGGFKPEQPPEPMNLKEPPQMGERRSVIRKPGSLDHIFAGWHIPEFSHDDTPKLAMLSAVLAGWRGYHPFAAIGWQPRSNRLYKALVEAKLAIDVTCRAEVKIDPGLLVSHVAVRSGVPPEKAERVLFNEIEKIKQKPPAKVELDVARTQIRAWSGFENDGVTYQGMITTFFEMAGGFEKYDHTISAVDRVTAKDIQDVARKYLTDNNRTVVHFLAEEVKA